MEHLNYLLSPFPEYYLVGKNHELHADHVISPMAKNKKPIDAP